MISKLAAWFVLLLMLGTGGSGLFNVATFAANAPLKIPHDHYIFKQLQSSSGAIPSYVTEILQDAQGYIWLGTGKGLFRYDGYTVENFGVDQDNNHRLSGQYISDLAEDSYGNLWVATKNGLNKLNLKTRKVTHYLNDSQAALENKDTTVISDNTVNALWLDGKRLYVGTIQGLDVIDLNTDTIFQVLSGYDVRCLYKDDAGILWFGTREGELQQYNESSKTAKSFALAKNRAGDSNYAKKIVPLKSDLWLGTIRGLIQFDTQELAFKKHFLEDALIRDLVAESDHSLWMATVGQGLHRYSLQDDALDWFKPHLTDTNSIRSDFVYALYVDESRPRLWIGDNMGAYLLELSKSAYLIRRELPSKYVFSVSGRQDNELLIGTSQGLSIYDAEDSNIKHYETNGTVISVVDDGKKVWLGTSNGVVEFDKLNNKLIDRTAEISYIVDKNRKFIRDIDIRGQDQLLIASPFGLIVRDFHTQHYSKYTINDQLNSTGFRNAITRIFHHGSMWLAGAQDGLYLIDFSQGQLNRYLQHHEKTALDESNVTSVAYGADDYLWVGTMNGLFKVKDGKIIAHYDNPEKFSVKSTHQIIADENRLWVSTGTELAAFQTGENKFEKVHLNNSIFSLGFNSCDFSFPDNGYFYFCSPGGLLYFNPQSFAQSEPPPKTVITGFRLFNQPQIPGSEWLPRAIEYTNRLILDYQQSMLSFEFSSMNYSQLEHLYAYQMVGITRDDEWIVTDSKNRIATFTTQTPGDYTFRVKAAWDETSWSDNITELKVTILPPWWRSNYAYISYALMVLFSMIAIIKSRTHRLRKQAAVLKQEVADRTEKIQQLLEKKNELFANVSHELRTPLTLILGPAERVLHREHDEESKLDLQLIKRSGQRLRALVDQLLLFSKLSHFESLEAKPCSVKRVAEVISASVTSLMDENQLILEVADIPDVWVKLTPEDALQTILINLLSNAVKYTPAEGKVKLSISLMNEVQVHIQVADNGPGIPEDWQDKIFERFSRMPQHVKSDISGTGLGLAMVKDLVEMNGGRIYVSNAQAGGSVFTVVLPSYQATHKERENESAEILAPMELAQKDSLVSSNAHQAVLEADAERLTLLVIDDTADMRSYLASELSCEFNVILAEDGESGLQLIRLHGPDLVICDVMMPGINGFEVLQRLRADINISHTPLILLTAKEGKENRIKGFEERADDYIVKPFEMDELKARVSNILDLRKLWRDRAQIALTNTNDDEHELVQHYAEKEKRFLEKFKSILDENYHKPDLDVETFCEQIYLSKSALTRKIKALLGLSPYQYLRIYRIEKAGQVLKSGYQGNIGQLAEAMGFSTQQHFANSFKKHFGVSPKDYVE